MKRLSILILFISSLSSLISYADSAASRDGKICDAAESTLEVMRNDDLVSIANFVNINKEMKNKKLLLSLCEMQNNTMAAGNFNYFLDEILKENDINKERFKSNLYVNVKCFKNNFIVEAMEGNLESLKEFINYGFNLNRPILWNGKVGTLIDIAMFNFKKSTQPKDKSHWMTAVQILKKNKVQSCKELKLKCSIDI